MKTLRIPEAEGFYAFEVPSTHGKVTIKSVVASTKSYPEVLQFQEFLEKHGHGHEQIISLSDAFAVTEDINGPILWWSPNTPDCELIEKLGSYENLERVLGRVDQIFGKTEDWKAVAAVNNINSKLETYEAYDLSFSEYCESIEATKNLTKSRSL